MGDVIKIFEKLKELGCRLTRLRKALISELTMSESLLSVNEIISLLKKKSLSPHKTSIYRELDFLIGQGMARKITLGSKEDKFEMTVMPHHHHAVCRSCGDIKHVDLEQYIKKMEHQLARQQFKVKFHLVEFFGFCKECQ
jgi:Fe2+ or Zn2+ uptake regulation protein